MPSLLLLAHIAAAQPGEPNAALRQHEHATLLDGLGTAYQEGRGVPADPLRAADFLGAAATLGSIDAMGRLGGMLVRGEGVVRDVQRGTALLDRAAEAGDAAAQAGLALVLLSAAGEGRDDARARSLLGRAAGQGVPEAMLALGAMAEAGQGGPRDLPAARGWFRAAAGLGVPGAGYRYAARLQADGCGRADLGGAPGGSRDAAASCPAAIRLWLGRSVAAGDPAGMGRLATMLADGIGGPADPAEADALFWRALAEDPAADGPRLALDLAARLRAGRGVAQDREAARLLLLLRAGTDGAALALADMLLQGEGGPRDPAAAVAALDGAAERGSGEAAVRLAGLLRAGGDGVVRDAPRARAVLVRAVERGAAVERGDGAARLMLADMLLRGEGGRADPAGARALLAAADDAPALLQAADLQVRGIGGPRDPAGALGTLHQVADRLADPRACLPAARLYMAGVQDPAPDQAALPAPTPPPVPASLRAPTRSHAAGTSSISAPAPIPDPAPISAPARGQDPVRAAAATGAAADHLLCALAAGDPGAQALLLAPVPNVPPAVRLALQARLAALAGQAMAPGVGLDPALLRALRDAGVQDGRFGALLAAVRDVAVQDGAVRDGAPPASGTTGEDGAPATGPRMLLALRDIWAARIRGAQPAGGAVQPGNGAAQPAGGAGGPVAEGVAVSLPSVPRP
jgi:TPR repeat protein